MGREAKRIAADNEMKYDNLARSLAMMEDELKRSNERVKNAESRVGVIESELAEMNISKLHLRIDDLEDEIIREKMKINAVSSQLDDTFNEMLSKLILFFTFLEWVICLN